MKITKIKTVVVNAESRNWVLVKVGTDQPGLYGWGEASLELETRAVASAIEDIAPLAVGEDPTRIEHLSEALSRVLLSHGCHRNECNKRHRARLLGHFGKVTQRARL